uniref:Uncharacterized protein n=1 Tax=Mizugakiibacter sediminis TaxID=1475481 RepID=A0A0S6YW43_9GAMM
MRPYSRHWPSAPRRASVSLRPTSEPPAVSVIHCPDSQNVAASRLRKRGTARAISAALPEAFSAVAAPSVIASGQV